MREETKIRFIEKYNFSDHELNCVDRLFHKGNFNMNEAAEIVYNERNTWNHGTIPEDVRLWIAKIRTRLEHVHREPITQNEAHCLLRESIKIAQDHNCYQETE